MPEERPKTVAAQGCSRRARRVPGAQAGGARFGRGARALAIGELAPEPEGGALAPFGDGDQAAIGEEVRRQHGAG